MQELKILGLTISPWIYLPGIYAAWVGVLFILKRIIFNYVRTLAFRTKTKLDDILISAADFPLTLLIFTSGGLVVERMIPLNIVNAVNAENHLTYYFLTGFKAATIAAIVLFVDRFISQLIGFYSDKIEILKTSGGIAHWVVRVLIICLGSLVLLDTFGISITPVLASLGIGSLAVALALQPTLENFFSGIQIIIDKPIQMGHFIRLESGEEGYVYRIGWRSTWIRMPQNNMVVIPNKNLVNARVINYHYPQRDCAITLDFGVHYTSDLDRVERLTVGIAADVLKETPGGVKDFVPVVRFHTLGDSSIHLTVVLWVNELADGALIKHEFIKRLHKCFAREGIVIPYPVRAINYHQENHPSVITKNDFFDAKKESVTNVHPG